MVDWIKLLNCENYWFREDFAFSFIDIELLATVALVLSTRIETNLNKGKLVVIN